ncbi:MAG: GNAT family N-acetyltransferase [Acidimicrobiales bacterium]|nr:GNAT family N-acetyltransferase [Acidimicrobiales bacterium]HJM37919.1 GNAT family N-acetyltransferase [Acidimicrobiales bacterium]
MSACPTLETENLILRPFKDEDVHGFFSMMDSREVRDALHVPDDYGPSEAFKDMAAWLGQWELRGTGHWSLEEKNSGRFVGRAGLHQPERHDWPGVEVGWALHPDFWGHGYATEAGAAATSYGFERLGVGKLFSCILAENHRSQAVAKRLGFEFMEERILEFFPKLPHQIWMLNRD